MILFHVIFWLATSWLIASSFSIQAQEIERINGEEIVRVIRNHSILNQLFICLGMAMLLFYSNVYAIRRWGRSNIGKHLIGSSAFLLFFALVVTYGILKSFFPSNIPILPYPISFGILIFYFALSFAYGLSRSLYLNQQKQQQLALDKKQMELSLLRSQIQPHFLFNALNNLLSMVDQDKNPKLTKSFDGLSRLLRYVIEESQSDKVSIEKEIDFISSYAALQILRFAEHEVQFNLNVSGKNTGQLIEPGLFIPFVENAFKYGTEPECVSTIQIHFDLSKEDQVIFSITNPVFDYHESNNSTGIGIKLTRRRLNLIYPDRHTISITESDPFVVKLIVNTK